MKNKVLIFLYLLFILLFSTSAFAAQKNLGNGIKCDTTSGNLTQAGKTIKLKAAKSSISKLISTTKKQLASAKKGSSKAASLTKKIDSLTLTKESLPNCTTGGFIPLIFTQISGAYSTGTWNNTTFNTTGAISANFSLSGTILSASINIGGNMFGSLTPAPIEFQKDVANATFPLNFIVTGTSIGNLDITIQESGALSITESVVPVSGILSAKLDATFSKNSFSGTFSSTLLSGIQLAQGVMMLSK